MCEFREDKNTSNAVPDAGATRSNHPINCVDWNQANAYCTSVGKRLPTEEDWEYAARGTAGNEYPWGNTPAPSNQLCWNGTGNDLGQGNRRSTCPVGSYPAGNTPLGLAGNVWEWTSSGYSADYSAARDTASRVFRGGGWNVCRSFVRPRCGPRQVRAVGTQQQPRFPVFPGSLILYSIYSFHRLSVCSSSPVSFCHSF